MLTTSLVTGATAGVAASETGIKSVTAITEIYTFGQKVSAVAVEYSANVNPRTLSPSTFTVSDSIYNFRFTVVATSVVDRTKASSAQVTLTPPGTAGAVVKAKATPASITGGGTFTLNVDVRAQSQQMKAPTVTGEIAVTLGGTTQVVSLTGGAAVITLPTTGLSAGLYPVQVAYSGDPTYAPDAAVHQQLRVR